MSAHINSIDQPDFLDLIKPPLTMEFLPDRACKFPVGMFGDEITFCGDKAIINKPYCIKHYSLCFQPVKDKT